MSGGPGVNPTGLQPPAAADTVTWNKLPCVHAKLRPYSGTGYCTPELKPPHRATRQYSKVYYLLFGVKTTRNQLSSVADEDVPE